MIIDDLNYLQVNAFKLLISKNINTFDSVIMRSSPIGGNFFFAAVKSFDANIAIIGIFVLNAKNRNSSQPCITLMDHR